MNTEINEEAYFELISAGKNKSYKIDAKTPKAQSRIKDKMDMKKINLSYSYRTHNSSGNPISLNKSNYHSNNLDKIVEITPETQEKEENIGTHYQKSNHSKVYKKKKVKINENANSNIYINEIDEGNLNDSIDSKNFEFFDPRREKSPNGIGNLNKYKAKTLIVTSNDNLSNFNIHAVNGENNKQKIEKKFPILYNKYSSIKKLLEESQIRKRLITEIEDSRLNDYKKCKINRSNQILKSPSAINMNNYSSNKSYNDENQLDKSRDLNTSKRILIRFGDNIHTIIKIQKIWRGFSFRYKLYFTLTRYYKGRAFVSHFNVIKRNLFKLFKKLVEIYKLDKPVKILNRIFNKGKMEALKSILNHSKLNQHNRKFPHKIISFINTFRTLFTRRFNGFVVNVFKFKFFGEISMHLKNNSLINSISEECRHAKENKFCNLEIQSLDMLISQYHEPIFPIIEGEDHYYDLFQSKLKILKQLVYRKHRLHLIIKLKQVQIWRIRNATEKLNDLIKEKENVKEKEDTIEKVTPLQISEKINQINIVPKNKKRNLIVNEKFNKIVFIRVREDEGISRKILMRWKVTSYMINLKENLKVFTDLYYSVNNSESLEIISETNQKCKNVENSIKNETYLDLASHEVETYCESEKHIGKAPINHQTFYVSEYQELESQSNYKLLNSQQRDNHKSQVIQLDEIQSDEKFRKHEINNSSTPNLKELSESHIIKTVLVPITEKSKNTNMNFHVIEVLESHEIESDLNSKKLKLRDPINNHFIGVSESFEIRCESKPKNTTKKPVNYFIIEKCYSQEVLHYSTPLIEHKMEHKINNVIEVSESHEIKSQGNSEILQRKSRNNNVHQSIEFYEIISPKIKKHNTKYLTQVCESHEILPDQNSQPKDELSRYYLIESSESHIIESEPSTKKNYDKIKNYQLIEVCESNKIITYYLPGKKKIESGINPFVVLCKSHEIKAEFNSVQDRKFYSSYPYIIETCESLEINHPNNLNKNIEINNHSIEVSESVELKPFFSTGKHIREFTGSNMIEASLIHQIISSPIKSQKEAGSYNNIIEVCESHEILKNLTSSKILKASSIEVPETFDIIFDKTQKNNILKISNQNSQLVNSSYSLQINSSYEKPNKNEPSVLNSIEVSESLEIKSPKKEITSLRSIENSSAFEITSKIKNSDQSPPSMNTKAVKKIVKIIKKVKNPPIELQDDKFSLSKPNEIHPVILANSYVQPQLISQNTINYNISISNENNHHFNKRNMQNQIRRGVKLILIDQKHNFKHLKNKLEIYFSIWKETSKSLKIKSVKRNYFESIIKSIEPIKTKENSPKQEEHKSPKNSKVSKINHFKFMIHLIKITTRNSFKCLSKYFKQWMKTLNKIKDNKSQAIRNLRMIFKHIDNLSKRLILIRSLSLWNSKSSQSLQNSESNLIDYDKTPIFTTIRLKILLKLLNKMNLKHFDKSFKKWRILSSNIKKRLVLTVASTQLIRKLNKIFLKRTLPILNKNLKLKSIHTKRTNLLKSILDNAKNRMKVNMKMKFLRWVKLHIPVVTKKDFVKIINSFTKLCVNLNNIIDHNIYKNFLRKMKKSADWKNPKIQQRSLKIVTYHLKTGQVVKVERNNFNENFLWKYVKPLKYYFLKLKIKSVKLREIELRSISNKWFIERK